MTFKRSQRVKNSIRILQIVVLTACLLIIGRIYQLQIMEYNTYSPLSRENSLQKQDISPARGLIYDRNGDIIVENEPMYTITITPSKFEDENIPLLAKLTGRKDSVIQHKVEEARAYSWQRPSRLLTEVDFEIFSLIEENIWRLPGIGHKIESKRHYPRNIQASHILGYLREISEEKYNEYKKRDEYKLGDKIGRDGLEQVYENYLHGERGVEFERVNAYGQPLGAYDDKSMNQPPVKGFDLLTTLDIDLQQLAEKLLEGKKGGLVAMDPGDGAILALASSPSFNIRKLSGRLDSDYWQKINADTATPLYNRAIMSRQPPGSTFKPVMALIGQELDLISPETVIHCNGGYYKGRMYHCTTSHGDQTLVEAIQNSCNTYFFSLMNKVATQRNIDVWHNLVTDFGLGVKNNIDLPGESRGIIPDSTYLNNTFGKNKWAIGDLINLGVGQGLVSTSPLQMAGVASIMANGGYWVQPHIVRGIRDNAGRISQTATGKKKIEWISEQELDTVRQGMRRVVTDGSGRWYADLKGLNVAGKTGTAQNPHGQDHSWFISFAPMDDPKIAIAVLVENAGFGSVAAAPIASLIIEKYLKGEIERQWVYERMLNFEPKPVEEDSENQETEAQAGAEE